MNYILIDGSYFIYFRYHSMCTWWRLARRDTESEVPMENERFRNKFRQTFIETVRSLKDKLAIDGDTKCLVGKDCKKSEVWRNDLIEDYKGGRKSDPHVGEAFAMVFEENLFTTGGCEQILAAPKLEADDCIALYTQRILASDSNAKVWIVTSDMDYLQLACDRVRLFDMKFKSLTENAKWFGNAEKDLFCKIVAGDKSDNIPSVFPRCGIKSAAKYYENKKLFNAKLEKTEGALERFERNKKLIDFREIPRTLQEAFFA